jgi:hypothetical protein
LEAAPTIALLQGFDQTFKNKNSFTSIAAEMLFCSDSREIINFPFLQISTTKLQMIDSSSRIGTY